LPRPYHFSNDGDAGFLFELFFSHLGETNSKMKMLVLEINNLGSLLAVPGSIYRSAKGYLPWILYVDHWKFFQ